MRKRPVSYAWAYHARISPAYHWLSERAEAGLADAFALAQDALLRSDRALRGEQPEPPLTLQELGERDGLSAADVAARIERARHELFGTLSDSGIYYRARRGAELKKHSPRRCAAPDCERLLPRSATARRKYCPGSRCRVSAHRARRRSAAWP
jgi:hypothetical protein